MTLNPYEPVAKDCPSYIKFWGTRGSIPVAGPDYSRYGGNTSCLEVRDHRACVIIDAGTGIRPLGNEIMQSDIDEIHLFIGHTHWDHIIGFPFFAPIYDSSKTIHIYSATNHDRNLSEIFSGMLKQEFFPVNLDDMRATFCFHEMNPNETVQVDTLEVTAMEARHPGKTLCFRIACRGYSIGYVTDNEFLEGFCSHPSDITDKLLEPYRPLIEFFHGCSTLIHEAQYSPQEYVNKVGWGHSSISNVAHFAKLAEVAEWIVTHHDPDDNDEAILHKLEINRTVRQECAIPCRSFMAYDGLKIPIRANS